MKFTFNAYLNLIKRTNNKGYTICTYQNYKSVEKSVILRHDIDFSLEKAVKFASLESMHNINSTYFILLSTDFYNIASKESRRMINELLNHGHNIGLHFDETKYSEPGLDISECIIKEAEIMEDILDTPINSVSMHRPSKRTLESDINIPGMINTYGNEFFKNIKYVSDSRRQWREDVDDIIDSGNNNKLHILTHPFWYNEQEETLKESISKFIDSANMERYHQLNENFSDLDQIIDTKEV